MKSISDHQIAPIQGFYDYKNKYQAGSTVETCPAEISPELTAKMQENAVKAAKALGLTGYSRLDFMMKENGDMYCLEANTLPGMTPTSLIPQEAKVLGMDYPTILRGTDPDFIKEVRIIVKDRSKERPTLCIYEMRNYFNLHISFRFFIRK